MKIFRGGGRQTDHGFSGLDCSVWGVVEDRPVRRVDLSITESGERILIRSGVRGLIADTRSRVCHKKAVKRGNP